MTLVENSSVISAYVWYSNGSLTIRLKDGSHYRYKNVDQATFDGLEGATSKGSYFVNHIKNVFESEKVESMAKSAELAPWPFPVGPSPQ